MKVRLPFSITTISLRNLDLRPQLLPAICTGSVLASSPLRTFNSSTRQLSTTTNPKPDHPASARWLRNTKSRIGKCILFGLSTSQCHLASQALRILATEWRQLVAGREGFLTTEDRAGFLRHKVVWGEMDSMGHVNNVTYVRYAESARVNWARNIAVHIDPKRKKEWTELCTPKGTGMILRSIRTDYKFPMTWPDHISVFHKLRSSPSSPDSSKDPSAFILDVLIMSELHQRPAARCEEDIVIYDYKAGKKAPIEGYMRDVFERIWAEQESERRRVEGRIEEVESMVRQLEQDTWDREGAVEDMGGAGGATAAKK